MKFGPYEIKITPAGWCALAAAVVKGAVNSDRQRVGHSAWGISSVKAWEYHVYLIEPGNEYIPVEHIFYGFTKKECLDRYKAHQEVCGSFGPAVREGRTDDEWVEIEEDDLPTVDDEDEEDEEEDGR
jgi:hypothetical protein